MQFCSEVLRACLIKIRISLISEDHDLELQADLSDIFLDKANQVHQWRVVCKVVKGKRKTKIQHWRNTERAAAAKNMFMLATNE